MERLNRALVGVDIHKEQHSAVVLDCFGDRLGSAGLANRLPAFGPWLAQVQAMAPGKRLLFGLENTSTWGRLLAGWLLAQGYEVRDVAPIRTDRKRRRQPHPDKSDERDALAIARALLQDLGELPSTAHDDLLWTLSLVLTQREGLVREQTRVKNRLHALLPHAYPDYRRYFDEPFDGKTALAFWATYPSPTHLQGVSVAQLGDFLFEQSHCYHGRPKAAEILASLPSAQTQPYQAERDRVLRQSLAHLQHQQAAIAEAQAQLASLVRAVGQHLDSIPGVDVVLAAELLVGIGDVQRFATPDKLARYAGIAPKEWGSAGSGHRTRSDHGRRSLHATFFHLAVLHTQVSSKGLARSPKSRAYYQKKLQEGKSKKAALTCLMRNLVRVVWRMLKHRKPYLELPPSETA